MEMRVDLPGLRLRNPILTASGTFGYGLEFRRYGDARELGGIVAKGLSLKPRQGNPMPRVAETACGMLNAIGIQNIGVERFLKEKLPLLPWRETPVIANLYACDAEEFGELAAVLAAAEGVAALEVNISCPNVKAGGILFGQDPALAGRVTEAVKKRAGATPVIVKLSPNVTDIAAMARVVEAAGADMISCINTLSGMAVDLRTRMPRLANVIGGLSGPAIKPVALRCVHQVCRAVKIPVIGIGGISTAEDALEFILVGAHAVQIGTANFHRPDCSFRIAAALPELCAALGVTSWESFRGCLAVTRERRAMTEPLRMVVVDDEEEFANVLVERLHYRGVRAWAATSGAQALELAQREVLDAAIVDLQMPVMGGLECVAKLRGVQPELEIALLTGADDVLAREGAQALGCSFFQKDDMACFWDFIAGLLGRGLG